MSRGDDSIAPTLLQVGDRSIGQGGLTIREHFAALVLPECIKAASDFVFSESDAQVSVSTMSEVFRRGAAFAVFAADALLAELAKPAP